MLKNLLPACAPVSSTPTGEIPSAFRLSQLLDVPGTAVPHYGLVASIFPLAGVRAVDILVKMTF